MCTLSLLLLAACHSDDHEPVPADEQSRTVTITLNLPEAMTRAAVSEDEKPTRYLMQVIDNGTPGKVEDITAAQGATLDLYITHTYEFLFWADRGESYYDAATDLQDIRVATGANESMGIAYKGYTTWNNTDTAIDLKLDFAVCKITLFNTTSTLWADNSVSVRLEKAYGSLSAKSGVTGTAAPYTYTKQITEDIAPDTDIATFYVLTKAGDEQDITVLCNATEIATASATPDPGSHLTLSGNIGGASKEPTTAVNINVSFSDWTDVAIELVDLLTDATVASTSLAGKGTEEEPFLIQSAADLLYFSKTRDIYYNEDVHVKLCTDIDINTNSWEPMNIDCTFDGNGHTIGGSWEKTVDDTNYIFALFNQVRGKVCNLNVSIDITVSGKSAGRSLGVAGIAIYITDGTITGCTYSGTLTVNATLTGERPYIQVGGIVGELSSMGTISDCTFNGTIDVSGITVDTKQIGGIVALNSGGTLADDNKDAGTIIQ